MTEQSSLIAQACEDLESSPLEERRKALLRYVDKVSLRTGPVSRDDWERLHAHGWSDSAIYDAVTVTALFNFFNRWTAGCGVAEMRPEEYTRAAQRLKKTYL